MTKCKGEGALVPREKLNSRITCPECGRRLSAQTSPTRKRRTVRGVTRSYGRFYNRVPVHSEPEKIIQDFPDPLPHPDADWYEAHREAVNERKMWRL